MQNFIIICGCKRYQIDDQIPQFGCSGIVQTAKHHTLSHLKKSYTMLAAVNPELQEEIYRWISKKY